MLHISSDPQCTDHENKSVHHHHPLLLFNIIRIFTPPDSRKTMDFTEYPHVEARLFDIMMQDHRSFRQINVTTQIQDQHSKIKWFNSPFIAEGYIGRHSRSIFVISQYVTSLSPHDQTPLMLVQKRDFGGRATVDFHPFLAQSKCLFQFIIPEDWQLVKLC